MKNYKVLYYCPLVSFLLCICFYACTQDEEERIEEGNKCARFFNISSTDMRLYSIATQLKLKNDTAEFVPAFIEKYGYPLWEKAFLFPEKGNTVYAVPIKNVIPDSEIEAIWFFIVKYDYTTYTLYSRTMANEIIAQIGGDGIEETWMFDYFTRNLLLKEPASGLIFLPTDTAKTRSYSLPVEDELYCTHVVSWTGNGENYYDHGYTCWSTSNISYFFSESGDIGVGGGGGGGGGSESSGSPESLAAPIAHSIFRNSTMTLPNWRRIEKMLDKIKQDCMGEALYNGLKESLKGKTLVIRFNDTQDGSFGFQGEGVGISLGKQSESNQLLHEMMHAYRSYQETTATYNSSTLNGEIEAWYAQYIYTSKLPEYKGSKWEERDRRDPRRNEIRNLEELVDYHGNLRPGTTNEILNIVILNKVIPAFRQYHYTSDKYIYDYNRVGIENFDCIRKLTTNCL